MVAQRSNVLALRLVIAAYVPLAGACTSWRVQEVAPEQLVEQRHPSQMRVSHDGGTRVVLRRPWVRDDTLLGVRNRDTLRIALSSVENVSLRRFDPLETAGVAVLTTGVLFGLACAAACDFGTIGFGY